MGKNPMSKYSAPSVAGEIMQPCCVGQREISMKLFNEICYYIFI